MSQLYKVAIIGRVNVGKSTLFNRLISQPKAISSRVAGTTRDRNYAICSWNGVDFNLIDTGGMTESTLPMAQQINQQVELALAEADLLLLIVDAKTGLMPEDKKLAKLIRKYQKPILLVANKTDNEKLRNQIAEFYQLNLEDPWPVSANNGRGTGDLLDEVVKVLKKIKKPSAKKTETPSEETIKVAIIGQPNVGKSSLVNVLLNENRVIVSPIPHTTRDAEDITLTYKKQKIVFIDTAGVRRKSKKTADPFEKQGVAQSWHSVQQADLVLLMIDINQDISFQDKRLANELIESGVGIIVLANKWDLIPEKNNKSDKEYTNYYRNNLPFLKWAPLFFTSTLEKRNIHKILPTILEVYQERQKTIDDNALSKLLKIIVKKHKPSRGKGTKQPRVYNLKQVHVNPPIFSIKINFKAELHDSYLKFIEHNLRYKFGFFGVPIKIRVVKTQNVQDT